MAKVLITDKINDLAVKIVQRVAEVDNLPTMDEDKLCEIIGEYDAILVRSQTKITAKINYGIPPPFPLFYTQFKICQKRSKQYQTDWQRKQQ